MLELFVNAWLGHFVGDYLLQNQWMALGKSFPGMRGHIACTVHVTLYTLAIALFTQLWNPMFLAAVFIPHWLIDRWGLAWYLINARNPVPHTKLWDRGPVCAQAPSDQVERNVWKIAFAAPVYILTDNTLHWVCLWFTAKVFT